RHRSRPAARRPPRAGRRQRLGQDHLAAAAAWPGAVRWPPRGGGGAGSATGGGDAVPAPVPAQPVGALERTVRALAARRAARTARRALPPRAAAGRPRRAGAALGARAVGWPAAAARAGARVGAG